MSNLNNPNFGRSYNDEAKGNSKDVERKDKYTFDLAEPEEFPAIADMAGMVTNYLGKKISKFLTGAYKDFEGCTVNVAPNGMYLEVSFVFNKSINNGNDLPCAFTDYNRTKSQGSAIIDQINNFGNTRKKLYVPTQELKDGVGRFLYGYGAPNFKPDWNSLYYEFNESSYMGNVTKAVVKGIDIYKLLPALYGYKDENNEMYSYNINICRPTAFINSNGTSLTMSNVDYLLTVTRLNSSQVKKLANQVGIYAPVGGMNIITAD